MKKDKIEPMWMTEISDDVIRVTDAFEYVMKNHYDEVKEAVFEQEADNRQK